jgi:NADH:ubiquinone oxidoreductase subunit 4 (subunit M)
MVGIWGSRDRKIYASYLLFIYTLIGSIFALVAFLFCYSSVGTSNFLYFYNFLFSEVYQIILFLLIFFGFSVKIPMVPVHI